MSIRPPQPKRVWRVVGAALALIGVGCLQTQKSEPPGNQTCTACHGDERRFGDSLARAAPPRDLDGNTATSAKGVGAHERHLSGIGHAAVDCAQCHVVPDTVFSPGHVDSKPPAEVTFGTLATVPEHQATYDRKSGNCSDTYCHRGAAVKWTQPRTAKDACGTCHGLPPALPHPQREQCSDCHGAVIDSKGNWIAANLHVNGRVDRNNDGKCASCHGSNPDTGAPPPDLSGNMEPSARGVGAHSIHLSDTPTHLAVACNECHVVPTEIDSDGHFHADGRAVVTFGSLATAHQSQPSYGPDDGTCSNTYCHGVASGQWQAPRASDAACGSCHTLPPPLPHLQNTQCSRCHGQVVGPDQQIRNPRLHVNGTVEVDFSNGCATCHGAGTDGAPPPDLTGNTAASARGVGAHSQHLKAGPTHAAVACNECHHVPETVDDPLHIDGSGIARITFGVLAAAQGKVPLYDATTVGCKNTYCHGEATPKWQAPRSSTDACGTCHTLPPPAPHPARSDCSQCHGTVIDSKRNFVAPQLHVNGKLDLSPMACNACHGTDANGAPPPDILGHTSPSARGVGAHSQHLEANSTHAAVACNECHHVPSTVDDPLHIDGSGIARITFGALASAAGRTPSYDSTNVGCNGTYCHGGAKPNWQAPRESEAACGSCHGLPPPPPHSQLTQCSNCHGRVVGPDQKIKEPSLHVDGKVAVDYGNGCSSCHGTGSDGAPPPDLKGNATASARGVGAHSQHLTATETHAAVACNECHHVPATIDDPLHIDGSGIARVTFGSVASAGGRTPLYDSTNVGCSNTYCHRDAKPTWQAPRSSADACGTCHALPPSAPHPARSDCSLCHATVIDSLGRFIAPELHVNGKLELSPMACSGCHGTDSSGAPPPDTAGNIATTARGVGAHASHLAPSTTHAVVACGECHLVPTAWDSPGHADTLPPAEVTFGSLSKANGSTPVYSQTTVTCVGTYCHGVATPNWVAPRTGADACGSCHALPPPPPHPIASDCSRCHSSVIDASSNFIAPELHVNGKLELSPMACSGCHGTDSSGAPPPDTAGNTATSARGVGAHASHLAPSTTHAVVACGECHVVPAAWDSPGHADTLPPAEVTFGSLSKTNQATPVYSATALSCAGTYCHGAATPNWVAPRTDADACGSCHTLPPPPPHSQLTDCSRCHGRVIDSLRTFVRPDLHVNGQVDVAENCSSCHGNATNAAPPTDTSGSSDPTRIGVGAHQVHLSGGSYSRPLACSECHVVPATIDAPGHLDLGTSNPADVSITGPASVNGRTPAWDHASAACSGTWCHGPEDILNRSPDWVAPTGNLTCTSCHGMPPDSPHVMFTQCNLCHAGVDAQNRITDRSLHVNGKVDML
jgi:predicted CxxxxCH...CXXCH cytochrome family protein